MEAIFIDKRPTFVEHDYVHHTRAGLEMYGVCPYHTYILP